MGHDLPVALRVSIQSCCMYMHIIHASIRAGQTFGALPPTQDLKSHTINNSVSNATCGCGNRWVGPYARRRTQIGPTQQGHDDMSWNLEYNKVQATK